MFVCTVCTYPSRLADACDNPACIANPSANHVRLRAQAAEYEARRKADEERLAFRQRIRHAGFTAL